MRLSASLIGAAKAEATESGSESPPSARASWRRGQRRNADRRRKYAAKPLRRAPG